jgi:hypothetical protein
VYGAFSIAATHDYFGWNRSRWQGLDYLMEDLHVPPGQIDGGFEFNGWYGYDVNYRERAGVSWWWVQNNEYVVAFGPLDGYREVLRVPYDRWLQGAQGNLVVLARADGSSNRANMVPAQ